MLSQDEAKKLCAVNHPALAGYFQDGKLHEHDLLGTIFYLFNEKVLDPVFENNDIRGTLIALKKGSNKPSLYFDKYFVESLFSNKNEISAKEAGSKIMSKSFLVLMSTVLEITSGIKSKSSGIVAWGEEENIENGYLEWARKRKGPRLIYFLFLSLLVITGLITHKEAVYSLFLVLPFIFYALLMHSESKTYFDLSDKKEMEQKRIKYKNLYLFLQDYPLPEHTFTNEFLPFSIAFGFDRSWYKDFDVVLETIYTRKTLLDEVITK